MTFTLSQVLWFGLGYIVLSSLANALNPKDKSVFGTTRRFLLNLTNSASQYANEELHLKLPTQADVTEPSA